MRSRRPVQVADLAYLVILRPAGWIADDMHRVVKASVVGHKSICTVRLDAMSAPDYVGRKLEGLPPFCGDRIGASEMDPSGSKQRF